LIQTLILTISLTPLEMIQQAVMQVQFNIK
jgi:hypothetical protein